MKKVIEKYKKGIFVYVLLNSFALAVNLFEIENYSDNGYYRTYYFTRYSMSDPTGLWPFVNFTYYADAGAFQVSGFNGIFFQYGFGEFLLYMGIMVTFLVYKAYIVTPKVKVPKVG